MVKLYHNVFNKKLPLPEGRGSAHSAYILHPPISVSRGSCGNCLLSWLDDVRACLELKEMTL